MPSLQEKLKNAPSPELPLPSAPQFLLFFLMLGWMVLAPIIVGIIAAFLPTSWPETAGTLLASLLLAAMLILPVTALVGLATWRNWIGFKPFSLALLATTLYLSVAALIRAVTEPGGSAEAILYIIALTAAALLIGGLGLLLAGVPKWMVAHAFGFDPPPLAGLLAALALIAIVTVGWPLTGALGDSWISQLILLQAFALGLPQIIMFWGAVLGIITFNFQHRKALAAMVALCIYVAAVPAQIVPHGDWAALPLMIIAIPLGLLMIELRALTGSIWAGLLYLTCFWAAPLLFTDPRDELPLITQPWQTTAYLWMIIGTAGLVLLLWAGRQFLTPRWRLSKWPTMALALLVTLVLWAGWFGLWAIIGYPGFHNDGFLIIMQEQADLQGAESMADLQARRAFVRDQLIATAEQSQAPVRQALNEAGLEYRPFYIINMIEVRGNHRRMNDFADLPGVARVMLNPNVRPYPLDFNLPYGAELPDAGQGVEWNIDQVNADEVWEMDITGQGIVVAGQDTGYDFSHPVLLEAYRGYNGTDRVNNNFNWHDAWGDSEVPFDDDQHGTHTMGTILGQGENGNDAIGVAPGAEWIGCRNMQRGLGNPASYTDCMEFFLAPYPVGGTAFEDGDVSQSPHVVNNSWGCPDIEGCDDDVLEPALDALRAAGIMMVVSAGNDGPSYKTVAEPPAIYDSAFSVGATDRFGDITGFSSRGPVPDDETLMKPDIAAPGQGIRSSVPGGGFGTADGTSMAGPHVAGLVALVWSANPNLIGQIDATEEIIRQSARQVEVSTACAIDSTRQGESTLMDDLEALSNPAPCACGDVAGTPNNIYGWGEIDALAAVELAKAWELGQ